MQRRLACLSVAALLFACAGAFAAEEPTPADVLAAIDDLGAGEGANGDAPAPPLASADNPLVLTPAAVIGLTVRHSPEIRQADDQRREEEGRYDFFIVSRESFTYGTALDFQYNRDRYRYWRDLAKYAQSTVYARKEFYNTAAVSVATGYVHDDYQYGHAGNAFAESLVELPLFASREALERSNAKIDQQNEVNDARLGYYREMRMEIQNSLESLSFAQRNQEGLRYQREYAEDLRRLLEVARSLRERDASGDVAKLEATIASVVASIESESENFRQSVERLKNNMGIPFDTPVVVDESHFNPFDGETQDDLERIALATDEEIKTLLNSVKSAQAELQLARKGKWDTSLFVGGRKEFEGAGDDVGDGTYSVSTGVRIERIDNRISESLERIALASLRGYRAALVSRKREIHTNTTGACATAMALARRGTGARDQPRPIPRGFRERRGAIQAGGHQRRRRAREAKAHRERAGQHSLVAPGCARVPRAPYLRDRPL